MSRRRTTPRSRGLTLVEAVISVVVVGLMLAASLRAGAMVAATQLDTRDRGLAQRLAASMAVELRATGFGGENTSFRDFWDHGDTRESYVSMDEYHGWASQPPRDLSGTVVVGADRLKRLVEVSWFDLDQNAKSDIPTRYKLATVRVMRGSQTLAELEVMRSVSGAAAFAGVWGTDGEPVVDPVFNKEVLVSDLINDGIAIQTVDVIQDETEGVLGVELLR